MQKERITVTLDPDLVARLDRLAEVLDQSRSRLMERLLDTAVEEEEQLMDKLASPVIGPIVQSIIDHPKLMATLAKLIGEQMSPEEVLRWQDASPKVRAARDRLRNERGRRNDLRTPEAAS